MKCELFADAECWDFKKNFPDEFASYGCGPGGIGDFAVPDTVWFLSIKPACAIHDWGYRHCKEASEMDRERHDRILKNNALLIVRNHTKPGILRRLRERRVKTYYFFVAFGGGPSYWGERNKPEEMQAV